MSDRAKYVDVSKLRERLDGLRPKMHGPPLEEWATTRDLAIDEFGSIIDELAYMKVDHDRIWFHDGRQIPEPLRILGPLPDRFCGCSGSQARDSQ
ncbi:MAG: hypothetical protein ACE5NA_00010 [Nitrospiraceae bacterium]